MELKNVIRGNATSQETFTRGRQLLLWTIKASSRVFFSFKALEAWDGISFYLLPSAVCPPPSQRRSAMSGSSHRGMHWIMRVLPFVALSFALQSLSRTGHHSVKEKFSCLKPLRVGLKGNDKQTSWKPTEMAENGYCL